MRRSKTSPASPDRDTRGNFTPPPRAAAPAADVPGDEPQAASGGRMSPRNWRVPTRLNAILLIPVLVGLVMGGFQVKGAIDTWDEARDAEATARLVRASLDYGNRLIEERDVSAAPLLKGKKNSPAVAKARKATDAAAVAFNDATKDMPDKEGLKRRLDGFRKVEPKLAGLRKAAYTSKLPGVQTEEAYVGIQHPLMEFANELGLGTGNITSYGRTVYAVSLAKAALSLQRSIGTHILTKPGPTQADLSRQKIAFSSYAYLEGIAIQEYTGGGTPQDVRKLDEAKKKLTAAGEKQSEEAAAAARAQGKKYVPMPSGEKSVALIAGLPSTQPSALVALAGKGVTAPALWNATSLKFDAYRAIEADLADKAVSEASDIADNAKTDAFITGAVVVVALLAAFVLAGLMARQMSRSMRSLRTAAFGIAEQRLPMLVDQLSRTDPGRVDTRVQPIPITSTDEIGEVARAFDQVHREAVRLASEQALLRGNINAIFTNLSRRNQSLIEGQLTLITDLENNEADPDQLESLFRLDHLATRMRRNGENLLVLSGEEPGRRWDQPVPLVDVLRAASSEVEQYERIELSGVPEAEIHGLAVTDLVHLLAELLENATAFSSPQTKVRVTATRLPDGRVMIEIHDKGIGLTAEDFADINHRLANPPTVDAAISQRMGLFVVGRLSDRHGIRVQLRPSGEQAGTTSLVMLPDNITHGGGGELQGQDSEFTVSSIIPEQQVPEVEPLRTAAELGFDDSRYHADAADAGSQLDPVGRSLMREERRAALEAQAHSGQPQQQAGAERPLFRDEVQGGQETYEQSSGYDYPQQQGGYENGTDGAVPHPAYDDQHVAYDPAGAAYDGQQTPGYDQDQTGYDTRQSYDQGAQAYDESYYTTQDGYQDAAYTESGQVGHDARTGGLQEPFATYPERSHQDDWPLRDSYQGEYQDEYAPEAEPAPAADAGEHERVGFDRPGPAASAPPAPSAAHELTDAGLPRRGSAAANGNGAAPVAQRPESPSGESHDGDLRGDAQQDEQQSSAVRSSNDDRWQRAEQLREPKAGGVTSSGLPRRVPKANLVEGTAEQTPQGGPQVSRDPEEVRGRLSNLRRGVQRGRSAGSDTNGQGFSPDSTYNQER
ncbi:sensor histidine kinase [Streptomyces flavofungini]|uniref:sensor histidine kinase n=1 Tax=Streptomyces flavofungini TaxID=68200 RepID=UPI0025B24848|nr:nitrate- and nitrite sensing domain-containing protein [Streptomyces flavofungini]WJV45954.1 nitrate- and nitrite sensing domain-containing protein [Streptomyces flavofungini]